MGTPQEPDNGEWELVTEKEICRRLKLSPRTLYELRTNRLIPYIRFSKKLIRYSLPAVKAATDHLNVPARDEE